MMKPLLAFISRHLDSWEDICHDDQKRLRMNVIAFSFVISCVLLILSLRTGFLLGWPITIPALVFALGTFLLFLWQFLRPNYSLVIAWTFGVISLIAMTSFLLSGGVNHTGFLWVCIFPIVGTMMVPLRQTLFYNGTVFLILCVVHYTDLVPNYMSTYPAYIRIVFPISILVLILCNYLAAYTRARTQSQLQLAADELRRFAFTDPLTRAYNRRALGAHFGASEENATGLSFAIMDLDFFKSVNDTYGHETGDRVLCHLAGIVHQLAPPNANFYRWGGEEFLLVLKSTDRAQFVALLENIRATLEASPLLVTHNDKEVHLSVTISIGGMCTTCEQNIAQSIAQADELLYQAKESGRNRVQFAD